MVQHLKKALATKKGEKKLLRVRGFRQTTGKKA